jgi:hypothetical protein
MKMQLLDDMFALKDLCVHPTSGKPYVLSITGGTDNSIEGFSVSLAESIEATANQRVERVYSWVRGRVCKCRRPGLLL